MIDPRKSPFYARPPIKPGTMRRIGAYLFIIGVALTLTLVVMYIRHH